MKMKSVLFALTVAATLTACGGGGSMNTGDNKFPVREITTSAATLQATYPAAIKGIQDVEIRPKVSGFITKVCVHEGQQVSAGQLLFVLDNETYQAAVREAQAAVNTARAQMNTAQLTYNNNKMLFEKKIIGQYELSTAANNYATSQAQLAQAEAALASAKENLSYCYVKSPSAGVIGSLPYKVGALVSASITQPLTTVSNISTVEVYFAMTEKDIMNLTKKAGGIHTAIADYPAVQLQLADGTIYDQPGKVVKVSGVIDPSTGSANMIAQFANPNMLLKSGGSGQIVVPTSAANSIVIPQEATSQVQDRVFVYVVGKDNKVKYTAITVNPQNDGKNFIVTSGLKVGDRIVVKGITTLQDGMEIQPITEAEYNQNLKNAAQMGADQDDLGKLKENLSK